MTQEVREEFTDLTNQQKWYMSFVFALVFGILSSTNTYGIVNTLFRFILNKIGVKGDTFIADYQTSCPTGLGIMVHAIVFFFIIRGIMDVYVPKV